MKPTQTLARIVGTFTLITGLIAGASPSAAQDSDWQFQGTVYLFATETTLNVQGQEGTLSFSDALENLEFGAMAALAARRGRWTFLADVMYFDLLFENATPGPSFTRLDTDTDMTIFNAVGLYDVHRTHNAVLSVGGGLRYFSTDTTLTLQGGTQPTQQVSESSSWTDPVVALYGRYDISDRWSSTLTADYGSFVSDRTTYQVTLTFDYAFSDNWVARFGYRHLNVDNRRDDFRARLSGPVLGISYTF